MRQYRHGFTLIELLVVITIVVVLTALAFTFVKRGTETAYSARCMNNLKQLANAQMTIPADTGGFFTHANLTKIDGRKRNWSMHFAVLQNNNLEYRSKWSEINDQIDDMQMLNCPSAYAQKKQFMADHNGHARWRTYALNQQIGLVNGQSEDQNPWVWGVTRPDQVEAPSLLIAASESSFNENNGSYRAGFGPGSSRPSQSGMSYHHNDGLHVAYMDGHVERHTEQTFPYQGAQMPDGRTVRYNRGRNAPANDRHWGQVWFGQTFRRQY